MWFSGSIVHRILLPTTEDGLLAWDEVPELKRWRVLSSVKGEEIWLRNGEADERLKEDLRWPTPRTLV